MMERQGNNICHMDSETNSRENTRARKNVYCASMELEKTFDGVTREMTRWCFRKKQTEIINRKNKL